MTTVESDIIASGELVRIRYKRLEDAHLDWIWRTDGELAELDAAPVSSLSFEQYRNQFEWQLKRTSIYRSTFAVETIGEGRHIGNVMYYNTDQIRRQTELGIIIGDREYWGAGYGREAVALLLDHIFTHTSPGTCALSEPFTRLASATADACGAGDTDFIRCRCCASGAGSRTISGVRFPGLGGGVSERPER